jgi:vacuolar-type H+-ATPase catalytic subunit A/Vma1
MTKRDFFNENANHYSLIKYKTSYSNLTDDQMEQIDYEVGIEWRDYRMERV